MAVSRISRSTATRARKTSRGDTGRLSRHSAPRPSRHHEFTPNSSTPPEATSPGKMASRSQVNAAGEGDEPGEHREHQDASPHRHRAPDPRAVRAHQRDEVGERVRPRPGAARSRRAARRGPAAGRPGPAAQAPTTTETREIANSQTSVETHGNQTPCAPARTASTTRSVGLLSSDLGELVGGDQGGEHAAGEHADAAHQARAARPATYPLDDPGQRPGPWPCPRTATAKTGSSASGSVARGPTAYAVSAEHGPALEQPGDVQRRHQQRAEVVGGGADRERHRLLAGQQLAAAPGRRRRDQRDDQHADVGRGQQEQHVVAAQPPYSGRRAGRTQHVTVSRARASATGTARRDRPRRPASRKPAGAGRRGPRGAPAGSRAADGTARAASPASAATVAGAPGGSAPPSRRRPSGPS